MHARTREPGGTWRVWRTRLLSSRIHASLLQGSPNFQQDLYFPASTAAGCGHCIWPMRCSKILTAPQDHPEKTTGRTHTHFFGLCSELVCVTGGPSWYVMKELGPDTSWIRGTYWLGLLTAGFLHERNKLGSCLSHVTLGLSFALNLILMNTVEIFSFACWPQLPTLLQGLPLSYSCGSGGL